MAANTQHPDRFETRVTTDTHFGWIRTRLSLERTLMSWLRTSVSLIGFGFAIVQFFERIQHLPGVEAAKLPDAPKYLGLALIASGVLALLISLWQYRWTDRYLRQGGFAAVAGMKDGGMPAPAVAVAIILTLIGIFAFVAVLLRMV